MNRLVRVTSVTVALAGGLLLSLGASAQQKQQGTPSQRQSYDPSREVSVEGVVVSFSENASAPPLGAHVSVQTSSGIMDVHLGGARLLQANHFTLATGDTVRIVGENVSFGERTQFFARIIQKGDQSVALRSARGFPLRPMATSAKPQAGAL
jgi:hypothetical protein